MVKGDYEKILGRKISREEFKKNRIDIEEEAMKKICPVNPLDIDDDDEWLPEDELALLDDYDIYKMDHKGEY